MPRRLKTYQTSLGFFDLAVAAPSMKAAAEAWGSKTNDFKRGFAKETNAEEPKARPFPSTQRRTSAAFSAQDRQCLHSLVRRRMVGSMGSSQGRR
jgi:hypothetical protein